MKKENGFTLFEMLLSLSLLSILMLLIFSTISSARRSFQTTMIYSERLNEISSAQKFLEAAWKSRIPIRRQNGFSNSLLFEGAEDKMTFIAILPSGLGGQLKVFQIELSSISGVQQIQVDFFDRASHRPWGKTQILMTKLDGAKFWYLGEDENGKTTNWLPNWPWPERYPLSIRLEATAKGPVIWPLMTVSVPGIKN